MIEGKKIAIIGGNGLIGTSFVSACIENGAEVIVLDKIKSIKLNKDKKSLSFFKFDITKEESIIKFFNFLNNQNIKLDALVNVAYPKYRGLLQCQKCMELIFMNFNVGAGLVVVKGVFD